MIDLKILLTNLILGAMVLGSYSVLPIAIKKGISSDKLWANIIGKYQYIYIASIFISAILYSYVIYFVTKYIETNKKYYTLLLLGTILFLIGAILWAPFLYLHFIENISYIFTILALCLTTIGVLLITIYLYNRGNTFSKVAITYFLFHVFVLDNLIWSIKFTQLANLSE